MKLTSRSSVDISSIAESILHDLREHEPNRNARFEIEPGIWANADHDLTRIVLVNLIGNAWKYSEKKKLQLFGFILILRVVSAWKIMVPVFQNQ